MILSYCQIIMSISGIDIYRTFDTFEFHCNFKKGICFSNYFNFNLNAFVIYKMIGITIKY